MFEFSVAFKYLLPNWRQLSASIISLISILVIALVVWLIVVFFSVTNGMEKNWIHKLVAITAPIRLMPTSEYYDSYYYHIDTMSSDSDYAEKSLGEKLKALKSDPYNPDFDIEVPSYWPKPQFNEQGVFIDPVKKAFEIINNTPGLSAQDYEFTISNMRLNLLRQSADGMTQSFITQLSYIASFPHKNPTLKNILLSPSIRDRGNIKIASELSSDALKDIKSINDLKNFDISKGVLSLPTHPDLGEGVLLPSNFRNSGVLIGDRGYLSYFGPSATALTEQRQAIFIVGFYDPGLMPIGGKLVLANENVITAIQQHSLRRDTTVGNGINVWFKNSSDAVSIKAKLTEDFKKASIGQYWKVETYKEFEFSRDFIQQLQSDKTLFSLIALIIILVACSNIISMLILLVNDKKREIGILQSMGASAKNIALIFAFCGFAMGMMGSLLGILVAILTLANLDLLVGFLSTVQGHDAFNTIYFGESLPNDLSLEALTFVFVTTACLSILAGLVPALKASRLKPSEILRAD